MKSILVPGVALLVAAVTGCAQGDWKDTGQKCTGTEWKNPKKELTAEAAKLFQSMCDKGKTATDVRCRDQKMELQCK